MSGASSHRKSHVDPKTSKTLRRGEKAAGESGELTFASQVASVALWPAGEAKSYNASTCGLEKPLGLMAPQEAVGQALLWSAGSCEGEGVAIGEKGRDGRTLQVQCCNTEITDRERVSAIKIATYKYKYIRETLN